MAKDNSHKTRFLSSWGVALICGNPHIADSGNLWGNGNQFFDFLLKRGDQGVKGLDKFINPIGE